MYIYIPVLEPVFSDFPEIHWEGTRIYENSLWYVYIPPSVKENYLLLVTAQEHTHMNANVVEDD